MRPAARLTGKAGVGLPQDWRTRRNGRRKTAERMSGRMSGERAAVLSRAAISGKTTLAPVVCRTVS